MAADAGLVYVNDFDEGYTRRKCGQGFTYLDADGETIRCDAERARIESLVIPPAWQNVWICSRENGHVQARGRDEVGRVQAIYHPRWQAASEAAKFDRISDFAASLPKIRRRVRSDLGTTGLAKQRVVAAVVRLLDKASLRVGNPRYASANGSRGATTLKDEHVDVEGSLISLDFPGKSGKQREMEFRDQNAAEVIRKCSELDGQFLFTYTSQSGEVHPVSSSDVNQYLSNISGSTFTAKDFRTWWGSVVACDELSSIADNITDTERDRAITAAVKKTAESLGNTPAVCRNSYIHPKLIEATASGQLSDLLSQCDEKNQIAELTIAENDFAKLLPLLTFA